MSIPIPHAINRRDDGLLIEWDAAGHQALYPARELRLACPCAAFVDEISGRALLDSHQRSRRYPADVGRAGRGLRARDTWSDGHGTGIYTFQRLLAACPCAACRARRGPAG